MTDPDVTLLPGDIVLTRSRSWLSRLICLFTRGYGEPSSRVSHAEIVVRAGTIRTAVVVSADAGGVVRRTIPAKHTGQWVEVYRVKCDRKTAEYAVAWAETLPGAPYPVWRLFAHLFDWLVGLGGLVEVYLFRRVMRSSRVMHCSELVAWAYWPVVQFGKPVWAVTPDDIDDACSDGRHSEIVLPLMLLEEFEP